MVTEFSTRLPVLASWWTTAWERLPWILLGSGVAVLWLSLLVLMLSRWGQARPLSKCAALSVLVHVLLLGYAYMTNLLQPSMLGTGRGTVTVQLLNDAAEIRPTEPDPSWQADSRPLQELAQTALPELAAWQPESVAELLAEPMHGHEEPTDLLPDRLETPTAVPPSVHDLPSPDLAEAVPAMPIAALVSPPNPRVEQPLAVPLPSTPPTWPVAPDAAAPSALSLAAPAAQADRQGLALLADQDELADLVSAQADHELQTGVPGPGGSTSAGLESMAGRVPSRPVSLARQQSTVAPSIPQVYRGRLPQERQELVHQQGGSAATEAAVEAALAWLARAQDPRDGHWDTQAWGGGHDSRDFAAFSGSTGVQANTATTGLALLAFLAAGHTHQQGDYQDQVARGLEFLRGSQSATTGSLAGRAGRYVAMYCHGIATLAVSEAYIMTQDERLRPVLERAVHYTVVTQHPTTGGWRYQPGDQGDTSQFGWQLMALVSARSAGIPIPERVWQGANRWLQRVSLGDHGGLACYTPDRRVPSHSMTAEALACHFFLQTGQSRAAVDEAANFISREGLGRGPLNLYYYYYGTLALYQVQDHRWLAWNRALSAKLLESQRVPAPWWAVGNRAPFGATPAAESTAPRWLVFAWRPTIATCPC